MESAQKKVARSANASGREVGALSHELSEDPVRGRSEWPGRRFVWEGDTSSGETIWASPPASRSKRLPIIRVPWARALPPKGTRGICKAEAQASAPAIRRDVLMS